MLKTKTSIATAAIIIGIVDPVSAITTSNFDSYISNETISIPQTIYPQEFESNDINDISGKISNLDKTEGELRSYIKLNKGWDGYHGLIPDEESINDSLAFLAFIKSQNLVAPKPMLSGEGEVSLYWNIDGTYIEVGFEKEMLLSYLIDSNDRMIGEDDCKFEDNNLPDILLIELLNISKKANKLSA